MSNLPKEAINSDTLKPEASPFGKKPHGPLGRSIAVDTALGYIWKDYADRPHEWLNSARSYMAGKLRANGIVNNVTIDTLIKRTLNMAEENEWLGNRRMSMRCFGTVCRNYEREKREAKAHVTPHVAQLLQERAIRHPELFNQDGSPKTDKGFYETGFQPDITGATAIMEQYEAAQRERDAERARFAAEFLTTEQRKAQEDTVTITDEMINEHELDPQKALFAIPNHLVKSYGDRAGWHVRQIFGAALDLWLKEHNQDTKQAWRLALQYELKNPGMASTENDDAQNAPEQPEIEASATSVPETANGSASAPALRSENSNLKGVSDMPIGQLKVYPVDFGSIWYKGIKFSVTLEAGGTFDQAIALMDEFAAHKELIAPNCLVPSNVTTMQPATNTAPSLPTLTQSAPVATPAPTSSEPDGKGRVPGQRGTTNVTGVKKTVNDGKVIIELWSTGQYAEHFLRQDGEHAMIAALGIRLDQLEIGTKYPCNWIADWVVSQNRSTAGKQLYFRDVTGIRDNGVALPKAS